MSKNKKSLARQSGKIIQHIIHSQNQKKRGKQSLRSHKIVDDEGEKDDPCWDEDIDNLLLEEEEEDEDNQVEENSLPENGDAYKEMKVPILTQTSQDEILVNMNDSSEEIPPLNEINSPEEVLPRKVRDKKMCHCINSRVFPHRRKKCLLAKTLLTMTNRGSLDLPQKEMLTYSLNISSSSDSEEEKELEKKQCDCINSTLFPHRREKCLLRNTLSSKSNAIVSDLQDSNVNKLQQVEPSSPRSSGSDSDNLESYILESSSTSSNDSDDASLPKNIKKKKRKNSFWKQISVLSGMNSTINGFLSSKNSKVSTKSEEANLIEEANTSTRFYLINHYKHISFGGFALFIIFVLIFLRNLKDNFVFIICQILLFLFMAILYPYILGYFFGKLIRPSFLYGIHPSLQQEAYLLSCKSMSLRCSLDDLEILFETVEWKNPKSYLQFHQKTKPLNFLEIGSIRIVISWEHLIPYIKGNFIPALRIKQIFLHHVKIHLMKHRTIGSLNALSAIGQHQEKDGELPNSEVPTPLPVPPPPPLTDSESWKMFLYYDISFLLIDKLHVFIHQLYDDKKHDLILPDIIFHRHHLTKKYKRPRRNQERKIYSIYTLMIIIGKRIGYQLLQDNHEILIQFLSSGVLKNIKTVLKKRNKKLKKFFTR